jgi:hypothetical protein
MRAALGGHKGIVNLLLTAKVPASSKSQNKYGKTALHYACAGGHSLIARVLVMYGADPTTRDGGMRTPFDDAVDNGHANMVADLAAKLPGVALPARPVAPVLFKADATTCVVSWDAVVGTAGGAAGAGAGRLPPGAEERLAVSAYRLHVAAASGAPALRRWTLVAADIPTTTFKVRGLAPGTSYVTRVAANNAYGWGESSEVSDVMTTAPPPRGANAAATEGPSSSASTGVGDGSPAGFSGAGEGEASSSSSSAGTGPIMFWGLKPPAGGGSGAAAAPASSGPSGGGGVSIRTPSPGAGGGLPTSPQPGFGGARGSSSGRAASGRLSGDEDDDAAGPSGRPPPAAASARGRGGVASSASTTYYGGGTGRSGRAGEGKDGDTPGRGSGRGGGGGGGRGGWADGDSGELTEVLRTLELDLEEETAKRRVLEADLGRYTAAPSVLAGLSVDELAGLERSLEDSLKGVRAARERKMKEALGDEMSRTLCSVCLTKPKNMLFLPCKHLCACSECAGRIMRPVPGGGGKAAKEPQCPICRVPVKEVLDVYA